MCMQPARIRGKIESLEAELTTFLQETSEPAKVPNSPSLFSQPKPRKCNGAAALRE